MSGTSHGSNGRFFGRFFGCFFLLATCLLHLTAQAQPATTGTLAIPGEVDEFLFNLEQPGLLHLDVQSPADDVNWSLEGPYGVHRSSTAFTSSDPISTSLLALPAGPHRLQLRANQDATPPYRFRLVPLPSGSALPAGITNLATLDPASGAAYHTFSAQPGERLRLSIPIRTNLTSLSASVIDPYGNILGTAFPGNPVEFLLRSPLLHHVVVNGGYRNTGTGTYGLQLLQLSSNPLYPPAPTLALNTDQSIEPTGPFTNRWEFTVTESRVLNFNLLTGAWNDRWRIEGPAGIVAEESFNAGSRHVSTVPGQYQLVVWRNNAGNLPVRFNLVDPADAPLVSADGSLVNLTHEPAARTLYRRLTLTNGQPVDLLAEGNDGFTSSTPRWEVIAPDGRPLVINNSQVTGSFFDLSRWLAPVPGTYWIAFTAPPSLPQFNSANSQRATRAFRVHSTPDSDQALELGTIVDGTLPGPYAAARFRITLTTPRRLHVDTLESQPISWRLTGPGGGLLTGRLDNEGVNPTLLPAGEYVLTLRSDARNTPNYRFRVLDLGEGQSIGLGQSVTNTHTPGNGAIIYRVHLNAGQRLIGRALETSGFPGERPRWTLIEPGGRTLWTQSFTDSATVTSLFTGTHTLVVQGPVSPAGPNPSHAFALLPVLQRDEPLVLGSVINDAINSPGESVTYRLALDQARRISIDNLRIANARWDLSGPLGSISSSHFSSDGSWQFDLAPGEYRLVVTGFDVQSPQYRFQILDSTAGALTALGTLTQVPLDSARASRYLRVHLEAGQLFYLDHLDPLGFRGNASLLLTDPNGAFLVNQTLADAGPFMARATGIHDILVQGRIDHPDEPVIHRFILNPVPPITVAYQPGNTIQGAIASAGQSHRFTWVQAEPRHFLLDILQASPVQWSVNGAWGQAATGNFNSEPHPFLLPAGPAELVLRDAGDGTNAFNFRLIPVEDAPVVPIGVESEVQLSPASARAVVAVELAAGQQVTIRPTSQTGFNSPANWRFYHPRLGNVTDIPARAFTYRAVLAGRHYLAIGGGILESGPGATVRFQIDDEGTVPPPSFTGTGIQLGELIEGTLPNASSTNLYRFNLPARTAIVIDSLLTGASRWSLRDRLGPLHERVLLRDADSPNRVDLNLITLPAGEYELAVTGATDPFRFLLRNAAEAQPLPPDTMVQVTHTPASAVRMFTFDGTAGQPWSLQGRNRQGFNRSPYASIWGPSGRLFTYFTAEGLADRLILPETGRYHLVFAPYNEESNPSGSLDVERITPTDVPTPIQLDTPFDVVVDRATRRARFSLVLDQPREVLIDIMGRASSIQFTLDREGTRLVDTSASLVDIDGNAANTRLRLHPGEYVLTFDPFGEATNTLQAVVRNLALARPITFNTELRGTNTPASASSLYAFEARAGETFLFEGLGSTGNSTPLYADLYLPHEGGVELSPLHSYSSRFTVPRSGAVRLVVGGSHSDTGTNAVHRFRLWRVLDQTRPLTLGATISDELVQPAQVHTWTFRLTQPRLLLLDTLTNANVYGRLTGPGGEYFSSYLRSFEDTVSGQVIVAPAGDYSLNLQSSGLDLSGYRFRLLDITEAPRIQPGVSDTIPFDQSRATVIRRLQGNAGDQFYLDVLAHSGFNLSSTHRLLFASGQRIWDTFGGSEPAPFTLPFTGDYFFIVNGTAFDSTPPTYQYRFIEIPAQSPESLLEALSLPDLLPEAASVSPDPVLSGGTVSIRWSTANRGAATAPSPITDRFVIRNSAGLVLATGSLTDSGPALSPGQSRERTLEATLPPGASATGPLSVELTVDATGRVREANAAGNGEANNTLTLPLLGNLAPYPDLLAVGLRRTSGEWGPGSRIRLDWSTTNAGNLAVTNPWSERLVLSNASRRVVLQEVTLPVTGPLPAGSALPRSHILTLPDGPNGYGQFTVHLTIDAANSIQEFNADDSAERNNLALLNATTHLDVAVIDVELPPALEPGVPFDVVHTLTNAGAIPAVGTWLDGLRFVAPDDSESLLAQRSFNVSLAPGATARVTNSLSLPVTFNWNDVRIAVVIDAANAFAETDESNNRALSGPAFLPPVLTLQGAVSAIREDAVNPTFRCTLSRTGPNADPLSVNLTSSDASEIILPASIIFPPGQSSVAFDATLVPDGLNDGDQTVTLVARAAGFSDGQAVVRVIDTDLTRLALVLATNQVTEGGTVLATLSRSPVAATPLIAQILVSDTAQILAPGAVTIPAGAPSTTFAISAIEDDLIERTNLYTLSATAIGLPTVATSLGVTDNDVPSVTVQLAQRTVSEGDGPNATSATLTRSPVTTRSVQVNLESGNPGAIRLPSTATIPANQASVTIPVAAIDNAIVEGPRPVAIGGSILDSISRSPVRDIVPDVLTVTDDDGPTLSLRLSTDAVGEGRTPAAIATLIRNTATTTPLTVTLASADTSEATVPPSIVIPAGTDRITFPVDSLADGITDGNQSVLITASATGFVPGTVLLVVSDADRADLVIAAITFATNGVGGDAIPVTLRVENRGSIPVPGALLQRLSLSSDPFAGNDTLLGQISYPGPLAAGASFEQTFNVRLPDQPGDYHFVAETDVAGTVTELLESNNLRVSPSAVRVQPAYTATVSTEVTNAVAGSAVPLTGQARKLDGSPAPFAAVTIHVQVRGIRRTLSVVTGADGRFNAVFQPLPTEGGLYQIAAGHPGVEVPAVQDEFRLLGLALAPLPSLSVNEGESTSAEVRIENRTDVPLTGLVAEVVTAHESLAVTATLSTNRLAGSASATLLLDVATIDTSAIESTVSIRIRTTEGASASLNTRVRQVIRVPRLVATPVSLEAAMVRGRQTPVAFVLRNEGGLDTGPLTLSVASTPWLALSSPAQLESLPPGSNTTVTLLLTPGADLPLGDYTTTIACQGSRASLAVPARFRAISDGIGNLVVRAEDEYTYFAEGRPPLADARVILVDALTGAGVRTNHTGTDGIASFNNLNEAYYHVLVDADRHRPFRQTALVVAGTTTNVTAFLSRETIRYSFFVEPTTIEDSYSLRIESVFETQVPVPVVTIEPAAIDISQYPGEEFQIEVTVRNHGLVDADSVRIEIPGGARFTATPLVNDLGRLPGGASIRVPILIRRPAAAGRNRTAATALDDTFDDASCSLAAEALWTFLCGTPQQQISPFTIFQAANAETDAFGCDESELFARVFEYREIPYWTQPGADPDVAAFIAQNVPITSAYAGMTTFWRMCRPAPDTGALGPGRRPAATAAGTGPDRDVCAKASLQLDQSSVLTRDAFKATLEMENDTESPIESLLVNLEIRDARGTNVTDLFLVQQPELETFTGVDGTGSLQANATGRARWILVPSLQAAPTNGPALFLVSGTLSYSQGGTNLSIPLASAPISVYPQPELIVDYFHERDVFADDPFTPEIEPAIPYSLAVQVRNVGYGNARGLRLQGGRPQVIDNEKGLVIEFRTIGTQLESQSLSPALDIDLGAIPAGTNRIARWLFTASVQGSFTNFDASFEHTDALGGRRLSLVRDVQAHELTRIVQGRPHDGDDRPDMLVNDQPDPDLLPDAIHLSSGLREPVQSITDAEITPTGIPGEFQVAIAPIPGWIYLRALAPADAGNLLRVVRPDGSILPAGNAWLTDRFIRGGSLRPIRTNLFHLFDASPAGTYRLVFSQAPQVAADTSAPSSRVLPLPVNSPTEFTVTWSGEDPGGSGVARYDVLLSVDGGPQSAWITGSTATSALFRGEPGRSYAFTSLATDAAGNREPSPATPDAATTVVVSQNRPPTFTGTLTNTVEELAFLDGSLAASDPDPGHQVSFSLLSGAPRGFLLDPVSGRYQWNPSEADGPATFLIQVRASDSGTPVASTDATLVLHVLERNQAPLLTTSGDRLLTEGQLLSFNLQGSDPDRPTQTLRYSLVSGPAGASVNPVTGLFLWRPRGDQGGREHAITVRVSDDGNPPLATEARFVARVRDTATDLLLVAGSSVLPNGDAGTVPLSINAPPDLVEIGFTLRLPPSRITQASIQSLAPDVSGATLVPGPDGQSELLLQLRPGTLLTTRPLLSLGFQSLASIESSVLRVLPESIRPRTESAVGPERILARAGRLILIGEGPVLVGDLPSSPDATEVPLDVYGPPGLRYTLEASGAFQPGGPWSPVGNGEIPDDGYRQAWTVPATGDQRFHRATSITPR